METRYLANRDPNLLFGLIMDLPDAPHQTMPGDTVILNAAKQRIAELNHRHDGAPFLLFFRERRWSDTEDAWLGWERKRGKLEELNRLLTRGPALDTDGDAAPDSTLRLLGDPLKLEGIRFVITLDADTILPRDAARHLIATLAHPLNLPRLGPDDRSIERGYGIIQPRMIATLPSAASSRFSRIFADCVGVDPYSRLVSDLYQDLAGDASYYGKGIYDPIALNAVLDSRFPQGSILSHDLLEGAYTRVGLASDIQLFDQFPDSWPVFARRQHRWIRGDWQIAAWCTPRVPGPAGWERNPLSPIDRWKILDNLRRSLIPIAAIVALFTAWTVFPDSARAISLFVAVIMLFPALLGTITSLIAQPKLIAIWNHQPRWLDLGLIWARGLVALALLPHDALLASDAIARVVYRRLISRRHLLEWQPSRIREGITWLEHTTAITRLAGLHAAFAVVLIAATLSIPSILAATAPYLAAWIAAPFLMPWLDGSARRSPTFTVRETRRLRAFARLTWRYFDDFVGPDTSFLPPDNFQQIVRTDLAQRTSPTNIGLWLTSALTAYDFGFITIEELVERLENTFHTLFRLERYEGHILNWYDTKTLQPLHPRYVSTVDSGNLVASLWVAAKGLSDAIDRPIVSDDCIEACQDSLYLLEQAILRELNPTDTNGRIDELLATLRSLCESVPAKPEGLTTRLGEIQSLAQELANLIEPLEASGTASFHQLQLPLLPLGGEKGPPRLAAYWSRTLAGQSHAWYRLIDRYLSSVDDTTSPAQDRSTGKPKDAAATMPSLRDLACLDGDDPPTSPRASARAMILQVEALVAQSRQLADEMRMGFLFDEDRKLFSIGFNAETRQLDTSYYDLLASEARIASYVAITQGDVPAEHWLALGRIYARVGQRRALLSWSGTMFEYLMPTMFMRTFPCSLLDNAERQAIRAQMDYAERMKVPWGISESAFSALDQHHIYQYKAFGVPGLGARRALADDLVVAPYATALALPLFPQLALRNMKRLADLGMVGEYGFYDAIDFTPHRQPQGTHGLIAYTFMAHHQAMTLVSIGNALHGNIMVHRFHADGRVRSGEPMLWNGSRPNRR